MADRYVRWTATGPGRFLSRRLGLPRPVPLHRWSAERPVLEGGPLLHLTPVPSALAGRSAAGGGDGAEGAADSAEQALATALGGSGLPVRRKAEPEARHAALVVDATGVRSVTGLRGVYEALHPVTRGLAPCGRVVVLGVRPDADDHHAAAAQQALEGFVRSLGKELGGGRTAQLVRFAPGASPADGESTLRFLLSPKSAYVSGQVVEITAPPAHGGGTAGGDGTAGGSAAHGDGTAHGTARDVDWTRPLAGRTALVTGCARGIGASVAATLARDGAHVLCLDVPGAEPALRQVAAQVGGTAVPLDVTAGDAGERIADTLPGDGLDVLVHNAGITRDRRLVNMPPEGWDAVLAVNLEAVLRTTDHLLGAGALRPGTGRVVATASIGGIAGNVGQTNYGASKAGVIGFVRSLAPRAAARYGVTVNAVAPGFVETAMTAAMPLLPREAGRRMNSLAQGGLPIDVAETIAWLAQPASAGVNGQVVRVCGQSLLGA